MTIKRFKSNISLCRYNSSLCRIMVYLLSEGASFTNSDSGGLDGSLGFSLGSCGI